MAACGVRGLQRRTTSPAATTSSSAATAPTFPTAGASSNMQLWKEPDFYASPTHCSNFSSIPITHQVRHAHDIYVDSVGSDVVAHKVFEDLPHWDEAPSEVIWDEVFDDRSLSDDVFWDELLESDDSHDVIWDEESLGTDTLVDVDRVYAVQRQDLAIGGERNPVGESFTDRQHLEEMACENVRWDDLPTIQDIHHGLLQQLAMGAEYLVDDKSMLATEILSEIALKHANSASLFFKLDVEVVHESARQSEKPTAVLARAAPKLAGCEEHSLVDVQVTKKVRTGATQEVLNRCFRSHNGFLEQNLIAASDVEQESAHTGGVSLLLLDIRQDDVFIGTPTGMVVWDEEHLDSKKSNRIVRWNCFNEADHAYEAMNKMQSWIWDDFNLWNHSNNKDFNSEILDHAYLMDLKLKRAMCTPIWQWNPGTLMFLAGMFNPDELYIGGCMGFSASFSSTNQVMVRVENNSGGSMAGEGVILYWLPVAHTYKHSYAIRDTCWPIEEMLAEISNAKVPILAHGETDKVFFLASGLNTVEILRMQWDPGISTATAWGQAVFRGAGNVTTQMRPKMEPKSIGPVTKHSPAQPNQDSTSYRRLGQQHRKDRTNIQKEETEKREAEVVFLLPTPEILSPPILL